VFASHANRHAARGPIDRDVLRELVQQGLSIRQIAGRVERGAATVRHWLRRHGLRTEPARYARRDGPKPEQVMRECPEHGWTGYVRVGVVGTGGAGRGPQVRPALRELPRDGGGRIAVRPAGCRYS
jgi:hypothetical protein